MKSSPPFQHSELSIPHSLDILAIGISAVDDALYIDSYPSPNTKVPVRDATRHGGGLAATAMVAAAALGGSVAFMARFGDDDLSNYMKRILASHGVHTDHIIPDPTGKPYHSVIMVDPAAGSRTVFFDCRDFKLPTAADLSADLLNRTKVIFLDYLADPMPLDLAQKAHAAGVPIVGDIEGRSPRIGDLLQFIDYLAVSEEFAQWRTGREDLAEACAILAEHNRPATVVTAGARGCYFTCNPGQPVQHLPAFSVPAVDTNGCGDTFHGAFAFAIARGWPVLDALLLANACGALKAMGHEGRGGWAAIPSRPRVVRFLRERQSHHAAISSVLSRLELI